MISAICAIGKNRAIGKDNRLLWRIPEDLKRFKKITSGHTVIMGRKTFESIGRALPERRNIVITRDENYQAKNCELAPSLPLAMDMAKSKNKNEEIFIIGGGSVYEQAMAYCDKLYLTIVDDSPEADTFFPDYSAFNKIISEEEREHNGLKYKFVELAKN